MKKETQLILQIFFNTLPVLLMIALIPLIKNDYILAAAAITIIVISFLIRYEEKEYVTLIFGFIIMLFFETIFISTGVETFNRNSLFNIMPIWLPIFWAYGFVAIKRIVRLLS